jgi:hypothetical protein
MSKDDIFPTPGISWWVLVGRIFDVSQSSDEPKRMFSLRYVLPVLFDLTLPSFLLVFL